MRFVFVSDLHSKKKLYHELERLIFDVKANALIIGGDLFAYSPKAELQLEFIKEFLRGFIKRIGIEIYIIPGNCDKPNAINYLHSMKKQLGINMLSLLGTDINKNIKLIGYGNIPPSPFKIKDYERRDLPEDRTSFQIPCLLSDYNDDLNLVNCDFLNSIPSIEEELSCLNIRKSIWVMHSPPYGGILDRTYIGEHAGSKAIRKYIENVQPCLTLHGHIHEAPEMSKEWAERIGSTISVNAGSGEALHAVIFNVDIEGKITSISHNMYGEYKI